MRNFDLSGDCAGGVPHSISRPEAGSWRQMTVAIKPAAAKLCTSMLSAFNARETKIYANAQGLQTFQKLLSPCAFENGLNAATQLMAWVCKALACSVKAYWAHLRMDQARWYHDKSWRAFPKLSTGEVFVNIYKYIRVCGAAALWWITLAFISMVKPNRAI